jgi:hypothetical protein
MSVDQIKKFLEDAKEYPDTTLVTIGNAQVPLASLRALNSAERTQLSEAIANNDKLTKQLTEDRNKVITLANKAQEAYDAAQVAAAKAAQPPPAPSAEGDWKKDPWFSGVVAELANRDKTSGELATQLKALATVVGNAATIFTEDRWDRDYDRIDFGKREKKPTRQELIDYAKENKIYDRHNLPSISAAWLKMTEADRQKERDDESFERGREAGRMEQLAARVPQPGTPGPGQPPALPAVKPGEDILGDMYGDSLKDPELRALIEQLPPGMM